MTINKLYQIILKRQKTMPANSYVTDLFLQGFDRIIQKVGEEATEVIIASKNSDKNRFIEELADLWFHLLIAMVDKNIIIKEVYRELERRNND